MTFLIIILMGLLICYLFPLGSISGNSMYPTFKEGDIVIMSRLFRLTPKDVYYYERTTESGVKVCVIKRLDHIQLNSSTKELWCYMLGDNPDNSYDSRNYGYVPEWNIKAKVLFRIKRGDKNE